MAQDILTLQQQAAQRVERMRRHERELVCPRTPPAPAPPPPNKRTSAMMISFSAPPPLRVGVPPEPPDLWELPPTGGPPPELVPGRSAPTGPGPKPPPLR